MIKKEVSIIIPTYNRSKTLRIVIDSYLEQESLQELIVIDDHSKDNYSNLNEYISKKCEKKGIKYIYIKNNKNLGAARTRNVGIESASGKYILWGEDDAFISKHYLKKLMTINSEKKIVLGSIYYNINKEASNIEEEKRKQTNVEKELFNYKTLEGYYRLKIKNQKKIPFGHALILVPRVAYTNIKYYDYKGNGYREESDAQVQMLKEGYTIAYLSDAECYHLDRNQIEENSGQHQSNIFKYEFYKVLNNWIFLKRHFNFLKKEFKLPGSVLTMELIYVKEVIKIIIVKTLKKINKIMS